MATPTKLTGSLYAFAVFLGIVAVAVLINVISQGAFGRLDLTENNLNTLSQASIDAVSDLDEVEVTAYISSDLPETIRDPSGRERVMRLVVQKFKDRLEEYRSYSNGNMTLRFEAEEVVDRAKAALDRCGQLAEMGFKLSLRGCLESTHDRLMREVNDELWKSQPGY